MRKNTTRPASNAPAMAVPIAIPATAPPPYDGAGRLCTGAEEE